MWHVSVAMPGDIDEARDVYLDVFLHEEPITRSLGLDRAEVEPLTCRMAAYNFAKGMSLFARGDTDGRIAGFIFCDDLADSGVEEVLAEAPAGFYERYAPAHVMLEQLRKPLFAPALPQVGEICHIGLLGTLPAWRRLGLGSSLIEAAAVRAAGMGFKVMVAECSSPASVRCHERCGFKPAGEISYGDFEFQGRRPFAGLEGACVLMTRRLGAGESR